MSGLAMVLVVAFNLCLIFVLIAAPLGTRTIRLAKNINAPRARLWHMFFPLGRDAGWSGEILRADACDSGNQLVRVSLSWEGRDGKPISRLVKLHDVVTEKCFSTTVQDDSSLDPAFWADYRTKTLLQERDGKTRVVLSQTDRYRGLAFMSFRYFRLRRELGRAKSWAETGAFRKTGVFEHPLTQVGFAVVSALILWPLFGLTGMGLIFAVLLTLAVAMHELGHMAAFRLTGHKSVRLIFIPVLGGVAIGGRPYDSRFEVAFVALMGAGFSAFLVPVAIAACVWSAQSGFGMTADIFASFAAFCALFNLANLVPVWKFDGGQVLRQICRSRMALAFSSFLILSVFLAFGYGAGFSVNVLLAAALVFVILSLMTAGGGAKPRYELTPLVWKERFAIATGFACAVLIHGFGVLWAADNFL